MWCGWSHVPGWVQVIEAAALFVSFYLFFLGTPLLLGSWYGLLLALILVGVIAQRAVLEEATLRGELPGYEAYMKQVQYRLIPYVW